MFLLGFLFFYSLLYCISRKELDSEQKDRRSQEPLIAITFLSLIAALLVLAVLLGGVIRSIYKEKFPLFKFSTFVVTAVYVVLSLSRIDAIIASYNISKVGLHITEENQYITTLSADAAGIYADAYADCDEVTELAEEKLDCYFGRIRSQKEIGIRNFNLSQYLGKKASEQYFNQKMKQD